MKAQLKWYLKSASRRLYEFWIGKHVYQLAEELKSLAPFQHQDNKYSDRLLDFTEQTRKKRILLIEPNMKYHSECLPGYARYFNDLGYSVDVILSRHNFNLRPFCRMETTGLALHPFYNFHTIKMLSLDSQFINSYDKVLVSSALTLDAEVFAEEIAPQSKIVTMVHDFRDIDQFNMPERLRHNLFLLSYFNKDQPAAKFKTVNPHYFGNVNIRIGKNSGLIRFITVGRISSDVKNYNLLIAAVKKLISEGKNNFKVICIGWQGSLEIDLDIRPYFELKGKLDFPEMFLEMEQADFYLSLLDPQNPKHSSYCSNLATGSNQLVLGFRKPYIISRRFAEAYGYDHNSAVIYDENDLASGMKSALEMRDAQYIKVQDNIKILSNKIYATSKQNLSEVLNENK